MNLIRKQDKKASLLLRYLERLIEAAPQQTCRFCASVYPNVRPWNIEKYLKPLHFTTTPLTTAESLRVNIGDYMRKYHEGTVKPEREREVLDLESANRIYLEYLSQVMREQEECRLEEGLVAKWVECALRDDVQSDLRQMLFSNSGDPLRDAHRFPWKQEPFLLRPIIDDEHQVVYAYNPTQLALLCAK